MTDEQINAAIAKACGWRKEDGAYMWTANGINYTCPKLWDWCNDLNAMHEAERSLHELLREMYVRKLLAEVAYFPTYLWDVLTAPPRSRAKAFLRMLGKWEEAK